MFNTTDSLLWIINATLGSIQIVHLSCDLVLNICDKFRSQSQRYWISRNKIERRLLQCLWIRCVICNTLFKWSHNSQNIVFSVCTFDDFSFDAVSIVIIVFKCTNERELTWEYVSIIHLQCRCVWAQCDWKIWIHVVFCLVAHECHCVFALENKSIW